MRHIKGSRPPGSCSSNQITHLINKNDYLELKTFQYTDYNISDLEYDIDPDNNFLSSINNNCSYYTDEQFNQNVNIKGKLSIIHFNSRSLYANFTNIKEYLQQFSQPFDIICISETWINEDKGIDFEMDGYDFSFINRQNKGGGVAVYVTQELDFIVVKDMTTVIDNVLECLSVELCMKTAKNVIVSCVYRAGSPKHMDGKHIFKEKP